MALFELKSRFSGEVIFKLECESLKLCVIAAVKSSADLRGADLGGADLRDADLRGANLKYANLGGADLGDAILRDADLGDADLRGAILRYAILRYANLRGADLGDADLRGANLRDAKNAELILALQRLCPSEGAFVGWKKLRNEVIAKLVIPHDAERMNAVGSRMCRASKAFVHELFGADEAFDRHTGKLLYKQGIEVVPDKFDNDIRIECSHGIHFFLTVEEARAY